MSSPIVGPIAPENNPTINPQYYEPSRFDISAITEGKTTIVTTSVDHNYVIGQLVRLIITPTFGAYQLNNQSGYVINVPASNQVEIDIYSQFYDAFNASGTGKTPSQIMAIGDGNSGDVNASGRTNNGTYILGSFINISPA